MSTKDVYKIMQRPLSPVKLIIGYTLVLIFIIAGLLMNEAEEWKVEATKAGWLTPGEFNDKLIDSVRQAKAQASIEAAKSYEAAMEGELAKLTKQEPYLPRMNLTAEQNLRCLSVGIYTEGNGEPYGAKENLGWAIVNRAIDERDNWQYENNTCGVLNAHKYVKGKRILQYSGMGPYLVDVEDVVWGRNADFVPQKAQKSELEMKAWLDSKKLAEDIVYGRLTRKNDATHFIAPRSLDRRNFPDWVPYYMPVSVTGEQGLTIYFRDYGYDRETGEKVFFTKDIPYNPNKHR